MAKALADRIVANMDSDGTVIGWIPDLRILELNVLKGMRLTSARDCGIIARFSTDPNCPS